MKRIFALVLSFAVLFSCLLLPAGAMFDPTPVYQVQAQSAYIVNTDTNIIVYDKDSAKQVPAGSCGGFNLHWAFGSGIAAGRDAARRIQRQRKK